MTDTNADMDVKPDEQPIVVEKRDDGIVRPGDLSAKLLACRERADLDQDQAAIAMRLSPAMIKALETENFAELPDPPYVRGYLRSYARLDESNPQDLIRTYELLRGADPDSLSTPMPMTLTRVNKPSISPTTVRMLALVGLVLLLGVLSMIPGINHWVKETWHSFAAAQPGSAPTLAASQASTTTTAELPTTPAPGTSNDLTAAGPVPTTSSPALASTTQDSPSTAAPSEAIQPSTTGNTTSPAASGTSTNPETAPTTLGLATPAPATPSATATGTTTEASPTVASTTPTTANTTTPAETSTTAPTEVSTATPTATADGSTPTTAATTTETPVAAPDPNTAATTATTTQPIDGEVTVRMEFTQEVWMQVKDGSNKSIFESLNSPNTWKQFKTRTPLTFKIGNAPGVKLYLNGQAYDHAKYTRGSVARFTVN